jgi:hypothetical protein
MLETFRKADAGKPSGEADLIWRRQREEREAVFDNSTQSSEVQSWQSQNYCNHGAGTSDTDLRSLEILCLNRKYKPALIGGTSDK